MNKENTQYFAPKATKLLIIIILSMLILSCEKQAFEPTEYKEVERFEYVIHDSVPVYWTVTDTTTKLVVDSWTTYKSAVCGSYGGGGCLPYLVGNAWLIRTNVWEAPKCKIIE